MEVIHSCHMLLYIRCHHIVSVLLVHSVPTIWGGALLWYYQDIVNTL